MKVPFAVGALLFASIAANCYQFATRSPSAGAERSAASGADTNSLAALTEVNPSAAQRPTASIAKSGTSPAEVVAALKSLGVAPRILFAVAQQLAIASTQEERRLLLFGKNRYKWQFGLENQSLTQEQRDKLVQLDIVQDEMMQDLLGSDYIEARAADLYFNNPKFSGIPKEKLVQIDQLLREQNLVIQDAMRGARRTNDRSNLGAQMQKLDAERTAAIQQVLSPSEFETYQTYNSQTALNLQRTLATEAVDDAQYVAIYKGIEAITPTSPMDRVTQSIAVIQANANTTAALNYAAQFDRTFGPSVGVFRQAGFTNEQILARRAMFYDRAALTSPEAGQQIYERVTEGLTSEQKAALEKTQTGRELYNMRTPPKPRS